jgi:hypothetical protein
MTGTAGGGSSSWGTGGLMDNAVEKGGQKEAGQVFGSVKDACLLFSLCPLFLFPKKMS